MVLLYQILGLSAIAGVGMMLLILPLNYLISRKFNRIQKACMAATDKRIQVTNEVMQNVRIIKYFAWEERWEGIIEEPRAAEIRQLRSRYILWAAAGKCSAPK